MVYARILAIGGHLGKSPDLHVALLLVSLVSRSTFGVRRKWCTLGDVVENFAWCTGSW
jgi:hypothetical protein